MFSITLLTTQSCETVYLPDALLEAPIGESIFGTPIMVLRSGWLYLSEDTFLKTQKDVKRLPLSICNGQDLSLITPDGEAVMSVRDKPEQAYRILVDHKESFSVGRARTNDIVYKDELVSAVHARFSRTGDGQLIYADLSTNGSYINGEYMRNERRVLKDGESVLIPPLMRLQLQGQSLSCFAPEGKVIINLTEDKTVMHNEQ